LGVFHGNNFLTIRQKQIFIFKVSSQLLRFTYKKGTHLAPELLSRFVALKHLISSLGNPSEVQSAFSKVQEEHCKLLQQSPVEVALFGLPGHGKSTLLSALALKSGHILSDSNWDSEQELTVVPLKVSYEDQSDFVIRLYPVKDWRRRRCGYAKIYNEDSESKLALQAIYGKCDNKLRILSLEEFYDAEWLEGFLKSPIDQTFLATNVGLSNFREAIKLLTTSLGSAWPLLDHIAIRGRFDLPENLVITDLPGICDSTKSQPFQQRTIDFLGRSTHILCPCFSVGNRLSSLRDFGDAVKILETSNRKANIFWVLITADLSNPTKIQARKESLKKEHAINTEILEYGK
jgi:hypothetical protein